MCSVSSSRSGRRRQRPLWVPLSAAAIGLLEATPLVDGSDVIFQSPLGGMLSNMALAAVCRRLGEDCVPHGFRSTFRDWCAEHNDVPPEVAELALAHAIGNGVEEAYRRGDLLVKRRADGRLVVVPPSQSAPAPTSRGWLSGEQASTAEFLRGAFK